MYVNQTLSGFEPFCGGGGCHIRSNKATNKWNEEDVAAIDEVAVQWYEINVRRNALKDLAIRAHCQKDLSCDGKATSIAEFQLCT